MDHYFEGEDYKAVDWAKEPLTKGEYEGCTFTNCHFSNANLSEMVFIDCEFENCDFSTAKLVQTSFRDVQFISCKLLGLHFDNCNGFLFSVGFDNCHLNLSSFYQLNMKNTKFLHCSLEEVDFTETDLTNASFSHCNLDRAIFDHTILEKADLRSAENFSINPETNRIKNARFSLSNIVGLLDQYQIKIE